MKLKRKITKAEFEALPADVQASYVAKGDDYVLDVEPDEDNGELLRAKQRSQQEAQEAKTKLQEAERKLKELEDAANDEGVEAARKRGDVKTLEAFWKSEADQLRNNHSVEIERKNNQLKKLLLVDGSEKLARELAGESWELLLPHVQARLSVDLDSDNPALKVTSVDGQPSTLGVDELKKEFLNSAKFASIVKAVNSTGGGAAPNTGGGAAKKPEEYTEAERVKMYREQPELFAKLFTSP